MTRRTSIASIGAGLCAGVLTAGAQTRRPEPTALLFGTVFQDSYLALPGAKVVAYGESAPKKKYRAVTNFRGEYRIRVPAGDAAYVLEASAPRFAQARRTVQVYGIEKTTANLILKRRKDARGKGGRPGPH